MPKLYELLETKDRKLQEQRVALLIQKAQAPVIDLVIRWDSRSGLIDVMPVGAAAMPFELLYSILDNARATVSQSERELRQQREAPPPLPPEVGPEEGSLVEPPPDA